MPIGNAKVISFINLKGGVGKTTSAVNVAATLAGREIKAGKEKSKPAKVLLIDLDPQSNASLTLLNKNEYENIDYSNKTLYKLFEHEINRDHEDLTFDLDNILTTKLNNLNLDLLPSSLKLIDIQDQLIKYHRYYLSATDILSNALYQLSKKRNKSSTERVYTHIIIDCPPSLGLVTLNGLAFSDYYIVPTLLDAYSYWGLSKIIERVDRLKKCKSSCEVRLLGVLYSKVKTTATIQNNKWEEEFEKWLSDKGLGGKEIIFQQQISDLEAVRKAEADNKPLRRFAPLSKSQKEWENLVTEILGKL